ncbi:thiamine pyrophosphate-binding protein [Microbacterium sp. BWT-B31]|uniref:thiamine pyrophosphate-binding protein n=1 Tax=Microbacterium sp. BWT-B31 TaxID=3232072 RepID=UPI0035293AA9
MTSEIVKEAAGIQTVDAKTEVTGGELVVDALRSLGIRQIFGVPGGQTLAINDAVYDRDDISFITTRHEGAAAVMADAVGRLSGQPGVCLATTGPGATNLLTGVGGAMRDSSPVIVITCNNRLPDLGRDDAQSADHLALFRPLTKWVLQVADTRAIPRAIHEAAIRATSGLPGPVLLDFERSALESKVPVGDVDFPFTGKAITRQVPGARTLADPAIVASIADEVLAAKRPLLWIGNGVQLSGAETAVLELAEALNAPVITTFNSIGAVESGHPHVFGPLSRMGTAISREAIEDADLVLAIGNSLNAVSTSRWQLKLQKVIQIDTDAANTGVHYPKITTAVTGDARSVVLQLTSELGARSGLADAHRSRKEWMDSLRESKRTFWEAVEKEDTAATPMSPIALTAALRAATPDDAIIAVDAGNPGVWSHMWEARKQGRYIKPVGFGNMGFALPGAIAAKTIEPTRPVIAWLGDGSLGMTMGELETVVREGLSICIVVMNDQGYGNIRQEELHYHGERYNGVDFVETDYAAVARGFGIAAFRVDSARQLRDAVRTVLSSGKAGLIDARIDPDVSVWTHPLLTGKA